MRLLKVLMIAIMIALAITFLKYKIAYAVTIDGKEVGYVTNKTEFENLIQEEIISPEATNIAYVDVEAIPEYELVFLEKEQQTNEEEIFTQIEQTAVTTYRVYAIALNEENATFVNTQNEAEEVVTKLKQENADKLEKINITVNEIYTQDLNTIGGNTLELVSAIDTVEQEIEIAYEEQEKIKACTLDGVYFSVKPISGHITSRFGANESIRDHTHKGMDIAAPKGTPIQAAASGEVTYAGWMSGYGYLVRISHGNGIETYYGHCSKLYVAKGDTVEAGEKIAAVGSTGNSTGNHLHFEIRKNGKQINPQTYVYQ